MRMLTIRHGVLPIVILSNAFNANAQSTSSGPESALYQLGGAFAEQAFGIAADLCSQRVPESKEQWREASRQWREAHRQELDTLKQATKSLEEALKCSAGRSAPLDLGQFTMLSAQGSAYIMYGLAGASDEKARELCEALRAKMLDRALQDESLARAQIAVSAALRSVSQR